MSFRDHITNSAKQMPIYCAMFIYTEEINLQFNFIIVTSLTIPTESNSRNLITITEEDHDCASLLE